MSANKTIDIQPTPGTLIVEPFEEENKGYQISDDMAKKDNAGTVLAVGTEGVTMFGVKTETDAKVGDTVFFRDSNSMQYTHKGFRLKFVSFTDIYGVIHAE